MQSLAIKNFCLLAILSPYHFEEFLASEFVTHVGSCEDIGDECLLAFMEALYLLLYGALADEVIYGDGTLLSYAVCTVGSLCLDGGVPPWVHVYDIVGTGEVESQSASLE